MTCNFSIIDDSAEGSLTELLELFTVLFFENSLVGTCVEADSHVAGDQIRSENSL